MSTHSCVAGVALIYLVPYYRRAVLRALRKTRALVLLKYSEYSAKPSHIGTPAEPAQYRIPIPAVGYPSLSPRSAHEMRVPKISISFVH